MAEHNQDGEAPHVHPERGGLSEPSETTIIVDSRILEQSRAAAARNKAYLIVISGPHVGRMYRIDDEQVVLGRSPDTDLQLNDVGVSRNHARLERSDEFVFVEDLQSANGTFVNGRRVGGAYQLQDGDKITLGTTTILKFTYHDELDEDFQRQMYDAALRDGLTGAYNKKYLMSHLRSEVSYARRHSVPLSLLMFDVDHFKATNDTYGHLAGDHILRELGQIAMKSVRSEDVFARYGGEEFAVVCRGISLKACARLGDRIRRLVESTQFVHDERTINVTISVGVSGIPNVAARSAEELIAAADEALYAAKKAGRNRVMIKAS